MNTKYRKVRETSTKTASLTIIAFLFVLCNVLTFIDALSDVSPNDKLKICALGAAFVIECLAFLYCIVQDITNMLHETPKKFVFDNGSTGIPFVDREELLLSIISESLIRIGKNEFYYTRNIRYGERNGKTAFAKKLCLEIQNFKDKEKDALYTGDSRLATTIGNIIYVNYAHYAESFTSRIKTEFTYIKGKKNIVVVDNSYEDMFLWTDELKDPDVFFIFLNFNSNSDDALFFADDKILDLLIRLKKIPAFASICADKSKTEIAAIAAKLGSLSNNNIGTIIDLLLSSEFTTLLETDAHFVDFYFSIKHGRYQEASKLYKMLPKPPANNKVLKYKTDYELANLTHFLGDYNTAYDMLDLLLATICNDSVFFNSALGESLYTDIVLLQAHVKKHQGDFDAATMILETIDANRQNILWLRSHFSINILQLNECVQPSHEWSVILHRLDSLMCKFKQKRTICNSDYYFYEAYYPIVRFYMSRFDTSLVPSLIKMEDTAISYYEKEERRYLTNCYFIKAEFYRIIRDWQNAEEYYSRCYNIYCHNGDKDILYLVAITCKNLQIFENITLDIPFDWNTAIDECRMREGYNFHNRLISQMDNACTDQELCKYWLQHYRVTVTPIP